MNYFKGPLITIPCRQAKEIGRHILVISDVEVSSGDSGSCVRIMGPRPVWPQVWMNVYLPGFRAQYYLIVETAALSENRMVKEDTYCLDIVEVC